MQNIKDINWWLKWTGIALLLGGGICTTFKLDPANMVFLNGGTILWLIYSIRIKDPSLIVCNAGFLLIYVIGEIMRIWPL